MSTKTFISYRRDGGEIMAQLVYDRLISKGISVFYDLESLKSGAFDVKLYKEIEQCDNFLLILPAGALDRCRYEEDWVRKEIRHALSLRKNIIPLMLRGFEFPSDLPEDIKGISMYNGIRVENMDFFDAKIDKIVSMLEGGASLPTHTVTPPTVESTEPSLIAQVLTVSSPTDDDHSPAGKYSNILSTVDLASVCFHIHFTHRFSRETNVTLKMKIYNSRGRLVFDERYTANIKPTYDSMSVLWKVGSEHGCIMAEDSYRAELVLEDSGVFIYNFRLTSEKISHGFKNSVLRLFSKLETRFGISKGSISYGLTLAIIAVLVIGAVHILNRFYPGWTEYLTKPLSEWFK